MTVSNIFFQDQNRPSMEADAVFIFLWWPWVARRLALQDLPPCHVLHWFSVFLSANLRNVFHLPADFTSLWTSWCVFLASDACMPLRVFFTSNCCIAIVSNWMSCTKSSAGHHLPHLWMLRHSHWSQENEFIDCLLNSLLEQFVVEPKRERANLDLLYDKLEMIRGLNVKQLLGGSEHIMIKFNQQFEKKKMCWYYCWVKVTTKARGRSSIMLIGKGP